MDQVVLLFLKVNNPRREMRGEEQGMSEKEKLDEVIRAAQTVLGALNTGDLQKDSPICIKLRDVMIAYQESLCPPHSWDKSGERCEKCGYKDWMT